MSLPGNPYRKWVRLTKESLERLEAEQHRREEAEGQLPSFGRLIVECINRCFAPPNGELRKKPTRITRSKRALSA